MAVTVTGYNKLWENVGKKLIDFSADTFKVILVTGYTFNGTHNVLSDIGAVELATGNGYTAGGFTLTGLTYAFASGTTKWDANDASWSAAGGSIGPTNGAVIVDTTSSNRLICFIDFGGNETAGDDTDFKITFNASGILTIT